MRRRSPPSRTCSTCPSSPAYRSSAGSPTAPVSSTDPRSQPVSPTGSSCRLTDRIAAMEQATATKTFVRSDLVILGGGGALCVLAGVAHYAHWNSVVAFVVSAAAVCLLASLVGRSVEQLGDRFGPGATGVLQSALGNLPELFISFFALKAGLVGVVRAAIVGSILANLLLVLGLAFLVGGLKHGVQQLGSQRARTILVLMLLSVSAWALPSFTHWLHTPADAHEVPFSIIVSVLLIGLF